MQNRLIRAFHFLAGRLLLTVTALAFGYVAHAGTSPYAETVIVNGQVITQEAAWILP